MTGRPVFAESARENVLLPAPAIPVTTTRRPTSRGAEPSVIGPTLSERDALPSWTQAAGALRVAWSDSLRTSPLSLL